MLSPLVEQQCAVQARIDKLGVETYWRDLQLLRCELAVALTIEQLDLGGTDGPGMRAV